MKETHGVGLVVEEQMKGVEKVEQKKKKTLGEGITKV